MMDQDTNQMRQGRPNGRPMGFSWNSRWALIGAVALLAGVGVLAVGQAGGGTWVSFLPYLLLLACPLMMVFMMGSMNHGASGDGQRSAHSQDVYPGLDRLTRDERIDGLRDELSSLTARQEALRQDLARLEAERVPDVWNMPERPSERTSGSR